MDLGVRVIIPTTRVKNSIVQYVVLNRIAKPVIEGFPEEHKEFVFAKELRGGQRYPQARMNNSGWKAAPRRPAARYQQQLGRPYPGGFQSIRVPDLAHPALAIVRTGRCGAVA